MQVDPETRRGERVETLGEQRADRAGQHVAGPARRQRRVLEWSDRDLAVRRGDDGPGALEDDDLVPGRGGVTSGGHPGIVVVDEVAVRAVLHAAAGTQPLELPRVRRQDGGPPLAAPPAVHRGERAERLGVQDDRGRLVAGPDDQLPDELGRRESGPQPGAQHDRVVLVVEDARQRRLWVDLLDVVLGQGHRRRLDHLGREERLERLGDGERDEACAGPTGGLAHEQCGPGVVERAGDHEQLAERTLVAAERSLRQQGGRQLVVEAGRARGPGLPGRGRSGGSPAASVVRRPKPTEGRSGTAVLAPAIVGRLRRVRRQGPRTTDLRRDPQALDAGEDPALAIVEPILDIGREEVATARPPDAVRDRDRVVGFVGDRDRDATHPELFGPGRRAAVQADGGLARRQALDLDVAPADAAHAEAEHLGDGLLGRPAAGHRLGAVRGRSAVRRGQHALREALAERSRDARIRSTLMMSMPSSVVPSGTAPSGITASDGSAAEAATAYRP